MGDNRRGDECIAPFVCVSSEHEHAATEYLRIYTTHQVMRRKASPTHPKECQHRAWFYDLQLFSGGEHSHR